MSNDITKPEAPEPDDGFSGSLRSGRVIKGRLALWNDTQHWHDRDGVAMPSPLLAFSVDDLLRRWSAEKTPDYIIEKPLPDPAVLNAAIPKSEWLVGIDGKPRPPWEYTVAVYLAAQTGEIFTYLSSTIGGRMAFDQLREAVIVTRALRGERVIALVELDERPFKTNFGMRTRPHFRIIDYRTPGGGGGQQITSGSSTPQVTGPPATPPTTPPTTPSAAKPTLGKMETVKPVTTEELLGDEIPW
jgi:hypothetical protein